MAGIDENIVREVFEANGFLVCQANKYQVQSRKKRADENIDFFVENPNPAEGRARFFNDACGTQKMPPRNSRGKGMAHGKLH